VCVVTYILRCKQIAAFQDGKPGVHQAALSLTGLGTNDCMEQTPILRGLQLEFHNPGLRTHPGTAMRVLHAQGAQRP
jgi:hypothetical protein